LVEKGKQMKDSQQHNIGIITEKLPAGGKTTWKISLLSKANGFELLANEDVNGAKSQIPVQPSYLAKGRDFLVAIRALVFELTGRPLQGNDLADWVHQLKGIDKGLYQRTARALNTEEVHTISDNAVELPVLLRNRRLSVVDARSAPLLSYGRHLAIIDHTMDLVAGTADWMRDGIYRGSVPYGPHDLDISGSSLNELASDCLRTYRWVLDHA
jgi:hypothetical protein